MVKSRAFSLSRADSFSCFFRDCQEKHKQFAVELQPMKYNNNG
jgi:hypothetical protein